MRLPSPLFKMIDFVSQSLVECMLCKEVKETNVTVFKVYTRLNLHLASGELWREAQHSCTDPAQAASLVTAVEAIQRKEKDSCVFPCKASLFLQKGTMQCKTETNLARSNFNADVVEESKQKIWVLRKQLTSISTMFVNNQLKQTL